MNEGNMADLLHFIESVDGRRLTKATPDAWMRIIGDLNFLDAKAVVIEHFQTSTEWLTPAHIFKGVKALRAKRLAEAGTVTVNHHERLDPREEIRVTREITNAIAGGMLTPDEYRRDYLHAQTTWAELSARNALPGAHNAA